MRIRPSYLRFYVTLLAALVVFSLRDTFAQSLGELARQERARKLARQPRVTKVYTNEDLQREVIIDPAALAAQSNPVPDESAPLETPGRRVPVHLTFASPTIPATKEMAAASSGAVEHSVPTVPLWPAGMPLGDIARYYRQQIAPQIPTNDGELQQALSQQPALSGFAADKLQLTLAPSVSPAAPAPRRSAIRDMELPAPFVLAGLEGSAVPVIENIVPEEAFPSFPSPAIQLQRVPDSFVQVASTRETVGFEAPEMGDVILSFDVNAALGDTAMGSEFEAPVYSAPSRDAGREPLIVRFAAPAVTAADRRPAPIARASEAVAQPRLQATVTSPVPLETVFPWRYAETISPAPAALVPARNVVVSTAATTDETQQTGQQEIRVQRGDSLWSLALRHLGAAEAWPKLAAANPQLANPNHIVVGERLRLPAGEADSTAAAQASRVVTEPGVTGRSVIVRQGDSLWKLAESALGHGEAWNCIAAANPQITNADRIFAGQTLVLPSDCNSRS